MESANTVTYTVQVPGALSTKAIGENVAAVTELVYEVYRTEATSADDFTKTETRLFQNTATITNGTATVEFELVNDQNFRVLFWAQVPGNGVYTVDNLKNVTISRALNANAENYAAFAGADYIKAGESIVGRTLPLVRPIAQLNIGTDAASLSIEGQTTVRIATTGVTVNGLSTSYNVAENKAGEISADDYVYAAKPVAPTTEYPGLSESTFAVNGTDYNYVAMNYVGFAPQMGTNVEVTYTINTENVGTIENTIDNVPVKANHRTNIVGNLITSVSDYTITLNKDWADEELAPEAIYLAAALGGEFTLDNNLELEAPVVVPAGVDFVLNLNGKSIKNTTQSEVFGEGEGIIAYGNLTINGEGTVEGSTMAVWARGNDGAKVTINGGTYKGCAEGFAKGGRSVIYASSGNVIDIYGGTFKSLSADKTSYANKTDGVYAALNVADNNGMINVYGGTFVKQSPAAPGTEPSAWNTTHPNGFVAEGYKAISVDDNYHVFPEVVADAATAADVTAVTENTADVATALNKNNDEATMFMWNDVAYIAKYGEVVITSAADEATTVRGVVEDATGLKKATVAEGIEVVGNRTFRKCANLETVEFPSTLTEIGPAVFQSCSKLANVTIPASVTTIGEGAFAECTSLTSINIPDGITRLEKDVLRNTGLASIEIPASVNYIGTYAFRDCKQLKEVIINAPEFTIEANAFGSMAAPYPAATIYVANAEMKTYLESTLTYANQFAIVAPNSVSNAEQLAEALANGENVVMTQDITTEAATTAPYGNKYAFKLDGGVLDGNEHELHMECYGDDYGIMTSGGTIKNLTIKEGCRAVMIMYPQSDVILDNVNIGGDGVLYPINTGEAGAEGVNLIVTNSVLAGWTSYGNIESASFTNVEFKQGTYYNNIYGRVLKPYVNTTLTNCAFVEHMNLDLSDLTAGHKVTMNNCTVNGQAVNAGVFTIPTTDAQYDTELFTIDLPSWASSINDCVVFN